MRCFTLHSILIFLSAHLFSQVKTHHYSSPQVKIEYHTKNGLFDGEYISYHSNGNKKAVGAFKDNQRIGKWGVWDSAGNLKLEREYKNNFEFEKLNPTSVKDPEIKFIPKRNKNGFFDPIYLKQADIALEKRVWRTVYKRYNELLFANQDGLLNKLHENILMDSVDFFSDEEFSTAANKEEIKKIFFSPDIKIVGYKLKEDWFFNRRTMASEIRVIGVYPLISTTVLQADTLGLGWLYYPQLRKILSQEKVLNQNYPAITNLDDIFWYRHFYGQIYKETNYYDREISDYMKTPSSIDEEAQRIELNLLENEHDIWLGLQYEH